VNKSKKISAPLRYALVQAASEEAPQLMFTLAQPLK
jgi:hypothetical protein